MVLLTNTTLSLRQPELGFQVIHDQSDPFNPSSLTTAIIGTYPSFTAAHTVARDVLELTLRNYISAGFKGFVHRDISLCLRGLITADREGGEQLPLSEIRILIVEVWEQTWSPQTGCEEADELFETAQHGIVVKLPPPWAPSLPTPGMGSEDAATVSETCADGEYLVSNAEVDAHWSLSRAPWPSRRHDEPFRGPTDPPYCNHFRLEVWRSPEDQLDATLLGRSRAQSASDMMAFSMTHVEGSELPSINLLGDTKAGCHEGVSGSAGGLYCDGNKQGNRLGGGTDIGLLYRSRRHSSPLPEDKGVSGVN